MASLGPEVEVVADPGPEHFAAVSALLPQLSSAEVPDPARLAAIASSPTTSLLFARLGGRIVGTLTLAVFEIPTGVRAWIEDVVVDEAARGNGVASALVRTALETAADSGAKTVELTSRPSREDANRLYLRLGFVVRETNVYRYTLGA